ncbi:hypothetical protein [Rhodococcus xishaensis]|uniref:DUF3093 domain-containing protein n=1 Tax=Rhodococcus xishaensis TaxID=2487364 RepID=A0A438ARS0_9NOCA|nr:hypothetical protein [Rhodococcus xishaensis]RVW01395.1 hypothetical protein EGT50_13000 [Rhodococcus xishaensis]
MSGSNADSPTEPLFIEPGARWRTVAYGPVFCIVALVIELLTGPVVHWFALTLFAVILTGIVYAQVVAARRHVSVVLGAASLRQGTEELLLAEIDAVLPKADPYADEPQRWEFARSLGELSSVPRRRKGIGLRLRDGSLVQAWARDDDGLRVALTDALARVRGTS